MGVTDAQARRATRRMDVPWDRRVRDPRAHRNQRHGHHAVLSLLVSAFAAGRVRLRRAEDFSADLGPRARRRFGLKSRVSDTALWNLLARQRAAGFRETVQRWFRMAVAAKEVDGTFRLGVVSFDGKSLWTSTSNELAGARTSIDGATGLVTASLMAMFAVLTSAASQPCLDLEMVGAKSAESPAFRRIFDRVCDAFGAHFTVVTADAAMTCIENALAVRRRGKHYLFALKGNQPLLFQQAVDAFEGQPGPVRAHTADLRGGAKLFRELHVITLRPFDVALAGATELWRVVQRSTAGTSETRYFVSSLPSDALTPTEKLALVRMHWGIENGHHWTCDVALEEDDVQPCQTSREAIEVVAWLRVLAYNFLATWRAKQPAKDRRRISWERAKELLRDAIVFPEPERLATLC